MTEQQNLLAGRRGPGDPKIVKNGSDAERTPFITPQLQPVSLSPSWEARNLPNDELNFKGLTMERAQLDKNPPTDRWNIVYLTLVLHGIGTLMPWNMFITAKSYFTDYKLSPNYTGVETEYATYYLAYHGLAAQIPNVMFSWMNVFVRLGGNLTVRIVWSLIIEVIIFILTVVFAMSDSSGWPLIFFIVTMITVFILNMASGIYQNSVFGMAAKLPIQYTGAVVIGTNISGTFTAITSILSSLFATSVRTAAIYYFIGAIFVILLCFDTYFALPLNKFFRYNEQKNKNEMQKAEAEGRASLNNRPPYWKIFKQASPQLFNVFMVFFVTLSMFPTVQADIKPSDPNFWVSSKIYTSVLCFLTFNLTAMLGSLTTSWIRWPKPKHLVWFVLARLVFVPLFFFCKFEPMGVNRTIPVYINDDHLYWIIGILLGFTSGYFSSLAMMYAPTYVEPQYAQTAGMFAAAMLITGIFTGVVFSSIFPFLVKTF